MTEYFSGFPKIVYNGKQIKDITIRLDFLRRIKDNLSIFQYVQIQHGERPEDVANRYYNDPNLYWIVLYMNDIVDPYYDWLLTDDQLHAHALTKYENINATHHYETTALSELGEGVIVDSEALSKIAITNLSYEQTQNELKRKIKILKKEYIPQVLAEYRSELRK